MTQQQYDRFVSDMITASIILAGISSILSVLFTIPVASSPVPTASAAIPSAFLPAGAVTQNQETAPSTEYWPLIVTMILVIIMVVNVRTFHSKRLDLISTEDLNRYVIALAGIGWFTVLPGYVAIMIGKS